jgi:hypothetical protein
VDLQVELFVMQRRVQARLSTPWLEFDAVWLARQLGEGRPILRFEEVPFEWGEFRTLFRQVSEVLRRYDLLEQADLSGGELAGPDDPPGTMLAAWRGNGSRRIGRPAAEQGDRNRRTDPRVGARPSSRTVGPASASTSRPGRVLLPLLRWRRRSALLLRPGGRAWRAGAHGRGRSPNTPARTATTVFPATRVVRDRDSRYRLIRL